MIRGLLSIFGVVGVGVLWILLGLLLSGASLVLTCLIVYFFIAAAGLVPPLDFVPFVPYV